MRNSASRGHPIREGLSQRDRELIQLARSGDDGAFERLRRFYELFVSGLILRVLSWPDEKADVEDVEQETWKQVHASLRGFEGRSSFGTWLSRITTNKCNDHLRKKKQRRIFVSISTLRDEEIQDCKDSVIKHPIKDFDDYAEQVRPIADKLRADLVPRESTVVSALLNMLRPREIAIRYKIPIREVRRILNKFRNKCRKMRVEGMTLAERMRVPGKVRRRKRIALGDTERGEPE